MCLGGGTAAPAQTFSIASRAIQILIKHLPASWRDFVGFCFHADRTVARRWFLSLAQNWLCAIGTYPLEVLLNLIIYKVWH